MVQFKLYMKHTYSVSLTYSSLKLLSTHILYRIESVVTRTEINQGSLWCCILNQSLFFFSIFNIILSLYIFEELIMGQESLMISYILSHILDYNQYPNCGPLAIASVWLSRTFKILILLTVHWYTVVVSGTASINGL